MRGDGGTASSGGRPVETASGDRVSPLFLGEHRRILALFLPATYRLRVEEPLYLPGKNEYL